MRSIKKSKNLHKINNEITAKEVMLVGDNVDRGIYILSEALRMADKMDMDLVEMSPNANPIICKIMDYQKFLYEKNKNEKKPQKTVIKEVRINPYIDDNDFKRKIKQTREFLEKGFKVKLDSLVVGRNWENKRDLVMKLAYTLLNDVSDVGIPEGLPSMMGKKMNCVIKPKK